MARYVTVDLDWPTRLQIVRSWTYCKRVGDGTVSGRMSSGGAGVHIRSMDVIPAECPVNETDRRQAGDDPKRIDEDLRQSIHHNQVMWDKKGHRNSGEWRYDLDALLGEYGRSVKLTPLQYERKHGVKP